MQESDQLKEQRLSSKKVYDGVLLNVYSDEVRLPNGNSSVREWIKHPGASAVVPLFDNGDVMLIEQFRYPLQQVLYEVPAGKIDEGEEPDGTAARELKEETGIVFNELVALGDYHPTIGYSDEIIHLYLAREVELTAHEADEDEFIKPAKMPFSQAVEMAYSGKITDGKTITALLRAEHYLENKA